MSMFILAISCFTTSNLPWFMDLIFQVPMQYCSLQHWTLLLSPVTSTTGCCFCFGSISSFFLQLFLHSSAVAYWAPTDLENSFFSVLFFTFSYCSCEEIPHVQGWRSPRKMVGGVNLCLESNSIPSRDAQRAQTNLVHTRTQRPHKDWDRTVFESLLWRYRSAVDCCMGRDSGCSRPEYDISPPVGGHY